METRKNEYSKTQTKAERLRINRDVNWAEGRLNAIKKEDIISFLASNGIIPKYGFPIDVVSLTILAGFNLVNDIKLERDLSIAISEFAPGSEVVADGYVWKSAGLKIDKEKSWKIRWYAICPLCKRIIYADGTINDNSPPALVCDDHGSIDANIKKYIIPDFGFVTDKDDPLEKSRKFIPKKQYGTRPFFSIKELPEGIVTKIGNYEMNCKYSSAGELTILCTGKEQRGFFVCFACGLAHVGDFDKSSHISPYGETCKQPFYNVHLGHVFKTDVFILEINGYRIPTLNDDSEFGYSFLYALLEGTAETLGINRNEIDGCLFKTRDNFNYVLYDKIPGGAGLVKNLLEPKILKDVFQNAKLRLENCTCGLETSCYGCLRNYFNQFCHDKLRRGLVLDFLKAI